MSNLVQYSSGGKNSERVGINRFLLENSDRVLKYVFLSEKKAFCLLEPGLKIDQERHGHYIRDNCRRSSTFHFRGTVGWHWLKKDPLLRL